MSEIPRPRPPQYVLRAREVLLSFLFTFIAARVMVYLIMDHRAPDLYLHLGGTHVHHLNYGIFLLSGVGAYLVMLQPAGMRLTLAAIAYGIGLALTFDEFGMWLHLGGPYWQWASFDAVVVIGALLGLFAAAPSINRFRGRHWLATAALVVALGAFALVTRNTIIYFGHRMGPHLHALEDGAPQ